MLDRRVRVMMRDNNFRHLPEIVLCQQLSKLLASN